MGVWPVSFSFFLRNLTFLTRQVYWQNISSVIVCVRNSLFFLLFPRDNFTQKSRLVVFFSSSTLQIFHSSMIYQVTWPEINELAIIMKFYVSLARSRAVFTVCCNCRFQRLKLCVTSSFCLSSRLWFSLTALSGIKPVQPSWVVIPGYYTGALLMLWWGVVEWVEIHSC